MINQNAVRKRIKSTLDAVGLGPTARRVYKKVSAVRWVRTLNTTPIFHSLSPGLLVAIVRSFRHLEQHHPRLLENSCYLEFGLYKGFALWFAEQMSREFTKNFALYGFDSFQGLPPSVVDKDEPYWAPGAYSCSKHEVERNIGRAGGDLRRITLIEGWFSKELFAPVLPYVAEHKPAIVVIDSDVYESCRIILDDFGPLLPKGAIVLFDDFQNLFEDRDDHGERRALREFQERYKNFKLTPLFSFGWYGQAFVVEHEA